MPENPEVNRNGQPNTYNFLFIMKLQLQLRISTKIHTKNTKKNKMANNSGSKADKLWTKAVTYSIRVLVQHKS